MSDEAHDGSTLSRLTKTTLKGAVLFLLPMVLLAIVATHAIELAKHLMQPIKPYLPYPSMLGVSMSLLLAITALVVVAFAAGVLAGTARGKRLLKKAEESILARVPHYHMFKNMAEDLTRIGEDKGLEVVLVAGDGMWQFGYVVERISEEWSVVFLPEAPNPASGQIALVQNSRLRGIDLSITEGMAMIRRHGNGATDLLAGADLKLPN